MSFCSRLIFRSQSPISVFILQQPTIKTKFVFYYLIFGASISSKINSFSTIIKQMYLNKLKIKSLFRKSVKLSHFHIKICDTYTQWISQNCKFLI